MYYLYFTLCYLVSLLPFWLLYLISDFIYFIIYHVAGYRKEVVMKNLLQAFPEKTDSQRRIIAKKFYLNLSDMIVELIKLMSISPQALRRRISFDPTLFQKLDKSGGFHIHLGHYFNWEWANLYLELLVELPVLVAYKPLNNKAADRLFRHIRSRFGAVMIPANDIQNAMKPWKGKHYIHVLVADQNPGNPRRAYWFPFLNKMTDFYKGPELGARRGDIPVTFVKFRKIKRGHYLVTSELISMHPKDEKEGVISQTFVKMLEEGILEQPENWLWSHKRWKHEWKGEKN